jgi:N-acetylglucosaminyl-diphospho-decaprenol L-rhamnosyltransferase
MSAPPAPPIGLAVATVLFRSREMLAQTLPTWRRSAAGLPVSFVFVDHSPDDGCGELIEGAGQYRPNPQNPGFAAGANAAVAAADATHVLLLNPDVWLAEDTLSRVLDAVRADPGAPIALGLAMRDAEYTGIEIHPISVFMDRRSGGQRRPLGPSGGAAVFPRELFLSYGGFYEAMFAWGEDADLAFRLYAAGVRTRELDLALPHAWGHSVAGDATLARKRAHLLARNRILLVARQFSVPLLVFAAPVLTVAHLGLAVRRIREGLLGPFLRGVGAGLGGFATARRGFAGRRFGFRSLRGYRQSGVTR